MVRGRSEPSALLALLIRIANAEKDLAGIRKWVKQSRVAEADPNRIGKCAICQQIFWKTRHNSECCGLTCRKRLNQRDCYRRKQRGKKAR